ncbi:MAG: HAD family hydrolase [Treponema sp.]|jgi:putative hydrolase of the HAD superfamily|nr:HAD family hydrolase [Treponema sp.]
MKPRFEGLAFDLDGTLYPNYRLNIRISPFFAVKEFPLLWALKTARDKLRANPDACPEDGFYEAQARLMAEFLKKPAEKVREKLDALIYRGWEPFFTRIAPFPHVRESLEAFKKEGFKLGLLSDFPPEIKLTNMGLDGYWDAVLCSEAAGRLKPHPLPFLKLAALMGLPPERILYVGNSVRYDIAGAKRAGMGAALVSFSIIEKIFRPAGADFVFSSYRKLSKYMISLRQ